MRVAIAQRWLAWACRPYHKLVDKIKAGEYVDFTEMPPQAHLPRGKASPRHLAVVLVQVSDLSLTRKVLPDPATWVQCFAMYLARPGHVGPVFCNISCQTRPRGSSVLQCILPEPATWVQCFAMYLARPGHVGPVFCNVSCQTRPRGSRVLQCILPDPATWVQCFAMYLARPGHVGPVFCNVSCQTRPRGSSVLQCMCQWVFFPTNHSEGPTSWHNYQT